MVSSQLLLTPFLENSYQSLNLIRLDEDSSEQDRTQLPRLLHSIHKPGLHMLLTHKAGSSPLAGPVVGKS